MGAICNLNSIKNIYCNGAKIKTVLINNKVVYQSDAIDKTYNYFVFHVGSEEVVSLSKNRRGDNSKWNGLTDWGDGTIDNKLSHEYKDSGIYTVKTKWMVSSYTALIGCDNVNINITNVASLFMGCESLRYVDMSSFKTDNITDMSYMFCGCLSLEKLNMEGWDTSRVISMKYMFGECEKLDPQVSHFNVSSVTDMSWMFIACDNIDGGQFKDWDVSNVTDMRYMFNGVHFTNCLDLSGWDVSSVAYFGGMFQSCCFCKGLDISYWNVKNDANTDCMFVWSHCESCTMTRPHNIEDHVKHIGVSSDDWELLY